MVNFYSTVESIDIPVTAETSPLVLRPVIDAECMESTLLTTGNLITQIIPVTKWIHSQRRFAIDTYDSTMETINEYEEKQKESLRSKTQYLKENLFTDSKENNEYLAPTCVAGLGAFLTGTVITRKPVALSALSSAASRTTATKVLQSFPSRIMTPWILVAAAFSFGTPIAFANTTGIVSNRWLPAEFVENVRNTYTDVYEAVCTAPRKNIRELIDVKLPEVIKGIREGCQSMLDM